MSDLRYQLPKHARRGSAMLLVLLATATAFTLGLTFLATSTTVTGIAQTMDHHAQARQIAESGLAMSINYIGRTPDWRSEQTPGMWVEQESLHGGTFSVTAEFSVEPNEPLLLTALGRHGNASHAVTATLLIDRATLSEGSGFIVQSQITMSNSGEIDSFNSSLGPYGPDNRGAGAVVVTNAVLSGAVSLTHSAQIKGDLFIGQDANADAVVNNPSQVTGDIASLLEPANLPDVAPLPEDVTGHAGGATFSSGVTIIDTDGRYQNFRITNNATVQIVGHVRIRVDEDFVITNNGALVINDGSSLRIYVQEAIEFSGHAQVNLASGDPSRLVIFGCGAGHQYNISNNARAYAILDAPLSSLKLENHAQLYGAFQGEALVIENNAGLRLDRNPALLQANDRLMSFSGASSGGGVGVKAVRWMDW